MNEQVQTQLKIIVERAVRPVQATLAYKRKLREELLAHVTAVFDEELARSGDADNALIQTEQRFGDPQQISAQIESSLSAPNRLLQRIEAWSSAPSGQSLIRRAGRWAMRIVLLNTSMSALGSAGVFLIASERFRLPSILGLLVFIAIASAVLTFAFVLLTHAMRSALFGSRGRSLARATGVGLLAIVLPAIIMFVLYSAVSGSLATGLEHVRRAIIEAPALPLIPLILILVCQQIEREQSYRREWAELQIE